MAARIAPTPIRFIHGAVDPVVDPKEARSFHEGAREPKDLQMIEGGIHQLLSPALHGEKQAAHVAALCLEWFAKHLV